MRRLLFLVLSLVTIAANTASWRRYSEHGCIGGADCRRNGNRITVALESAPVVGIRFYAHDDVGNRANGKLRIRIDDEVIGDYVDIERRGRDYSFDGRNKRGRYLIIEAAADDEVVVKDIRIRYDRY